MRPEKTRAFESITTAPSHVVDRCSFATLAVVTRSHDASEETPQLTKRMSEFLDASLDEETGMWKDGEEEETK